MGKQRWLKVAVRHESAWEVWPGVNGLGYARLLRHSPPRVMRAKTPAGLAWAIGLCELSMKLRQRGSSTR